MSATVILYGSAASVCPQVFRAALFYVKGTKQEGCLPDGKLSRWPMDISNIKGAEGEVLAPEHVMFERPLDVALWKTSGGRSFCGTQDVSYSLQTECIVCTAKENIGIHFIFKKVLKM